MPATFLVARLNFHYEDKGLTHFIAHLNFRFEVKTFFVTILDVSEIHFIQLPFVFVNNASNNRYSHVSLFFPCHYPNSVDRDVRDYKWCTTKTISRWGKKVK